MTEIRLEDLPMGEDRTAGYGVLRDAGPVVAMAGGGYMVTTREAADRVFKDPETFSSRKAFETLGSPVPLLPLSFDPPEHTRYRRLLQQFFTPRSAASLEQAARSQAAAMVATVAGEGKADVVDVLCRPFPGTVFLSLFGLPVEDAPRLLEWKDVIIGLADLSGAGGPPPEAMAAAMQLFEYVSAHVADTRAGNTDGILNQIVSADDGFTDEEALGLTFSFVLAGLDSVTQVMSTTFHALATRPELRRQIVADPAIIPHAVEEMLRFDPANATVPRVTTKEVEIAGTVIPEGCPVGVGIGAANRDPAAMENPDEIDFSRKFNNLTFGSGPHRCLGVHLARLELRVALEEWHRQIPEYSLEPGTNPQVGWPAGGVGYPSLPLVLG